MAYYKIQVRNSPGWRRHEAATLGVSVFSANWQDEKFAAILKFGANHFSFIRIDVTDSLYRHNFMAGGLTAKAALAKANAAGDEWLDRHAKIMADCPRAVQIVRWGDWYQHPDFRAVMAGVAHAHDVNAVLREAVHNDAARFLRRQNQEPTLRNFEASRNFLLEEIAVNILQARALGGAKIYPGSELECLAVMRQELVAEAPTGLAREQFTRIKIEKREGEMAPALSYDMQRRERMIARLRHSVLNRT